MLPESSATAKLGKPRSPLFLWTLLACSAPVLRLSLRLSVFLRPTLPDKLSDSK